MFGTGGFALPTFRGLYATSHEVVGLVTQPDRVGEGHHQHLNPLKELAVQHGTPVFQPVKANLPESIARLREFQADLFVVAAYGQILSAELLGIPRLGAINVHASLLPKYRGAAPIQFAVINGETETGITIFQIEPKLDAGPILGIDKLTIGPKETYGELEIRLAELSVPLAQRVIDALANGTAQALVQDPSQATKAGRLKKTDGVVPWQKSSYLVGSHIRGVQPWPKPSTTLRLANGRELRLLILDVETRDRAIDGEPGTVEVVNRQQLFVKTGDGCVEVLVLQPDGKRAMPPADFLRGHNVQSGDRFLLP
jgi:methionyl-tRNA formyltransferase